MTAAALSANNTHQKQLTVLLSAQRKAFLERPMPSARDRIRNLDKLHNAILDHKEALLNAVNNDFGNRSHAETLLAEIFATLEGISYNRKRLRAWMKPEKRHASLVLFPSTVKVVYQPLGVVGIVAPWNFPIFLCLSPLIGALAAGNRAMIKTSEFAPVTSQIIKAMLNSIFSDEEVAIVEGDVDVSTAFTRLPFDHLVFTGATNVGKLVMESAAKNLTPVTLELGGKSPALIHPDFPIEEAATRLAFGKCLNAGQICVSPDYVFCPESKVQEFIDAFISHVNTSYPSLKDNVDYTAIINDRQLTRLQHLLHDAKTKGAILVEINPTREALAGSRKMPITIVLNPTEDMKILQEEIFGPILPIISYEDIASTIQYINSKPRPLALYYFDYDKKRSTSILNATHSGGVCINDTLNHVTADDIPFGGIGPSGMGHYHGREGFLNFSKAKGVVRKGRLNLSALVSPPWNKPVFKLLLKAQEWRFKKRKV